MRIVIQDSNRFGKLAPERLAAFEKSLGTTLPEPYRLHLQAHNGGYVDGAREIYELHHVHGIHDGPEWARFLDRSQMYDGLIPERLLPIADDPGGNHICIVLSGPDRGAVYFWDHERADDPDESITKLAPDFDAFLRGLAIKVAIARGQLDLVREAVDEVGLDTPVYAGKTMLDLAFDQGSEPIIGVLMNKGAKVRDDALIEAVRSASIDTVQVLLARGVDVNFTIPDTGFTALMLAASRDTTEIAELLLRRGADPAKRNRWGKTAAELAHSSKMKKLLAAK
jgi:cell wall assembly regulator SMI1